MIVKILGFLDLLTAIFLWLGYFFKIIPEQFLLLVAFYLLIKGVFFIILSAGTSIASFVDVIISGIIFLSFQHTIPKFLIILISLHLIIKGILSLIA